MTSTLKLISIPVLAGLLILAALPVLMPRDLPVINFPAQVAEQDATILWSEIHTSNEHNPNIAGTVAEQIVKEATSGWPGKPGGDWKCFTIRIGEAIIRTVYWHKTSTSLGDLSWFNHQTNQWGGAYPDKLEASAGNLPQNLKSIKGTRIIGGCDDNNPPPFTPATN